MKNICATIVFVLLASCSQLVDRIHRDIDRDKSRQYTGMPAFDQFRRPTTRPVNPFRRRDQRPIGNAATLQAAQAESDANEKFPTIKRQYRPVGQRFKSSDFVDNTQSSASLWSGEGRDNYLLDSNLKLFPGDLVVIKVQQALRDQISGELKRNAQVPPPPRSKGPAKKPEAPPTPPRKPAVGSDSGETKIYDKISSKVLDEINTEYVVVKAIKEILFRAKKRLIQVQALVPKSAVGIDKVVLSDQLLETKVQVLR